MQKWIQSGVVAAIIMSGVAFAQGRPPKPVTGDVEKDLAEARELFKEANAQDAAAKADDQKAAAAETQMDQDQAAAAAARRAAALLRRRAWSYIKDAKKEETEAVEAWDAYLNDEYWAGVYDRRAAYWKSRLATANKNLAEDQQSLKDQEARKPQNAAVIQGIQNNLTQDNAQVKSFQTNETNNANQAAASRKAAEAQKAAALKDDPQVAQHIQTGYLQGKK
jgi:hypothetical protein